MGAERSVTNGFATLDLFAIEDADVPPLRNKGFYRIAICRCDHQPTLALRFLTKGDRTRGLCKNCRFLGLSGLEEVGNPRQTTGNISGLRAFLRDSSDDVTDTDLTAVFHVEDCVARHEVIGRHFAAWQIHCITLGIVQTHRWT